MTHDKKNKMKPRWYGLFYGGSGYSHPNPIDDIEEFTSIEDAVLTLEDRYNNSDGRFPCVSEDAEIYLYSSEAAAHDHTPDYRVFRGPNGGFNRERC